jgi:tetratricopeptide (TPR) repeat protein
MERVKFLLILIVLFLFGISPVLAQNEAKLTRRGNKFYSEGKYNEAEIDYRKSLEKKCDYIKAQFNLGNALYQQKNYEEASKVFGGLTQRPMNQATTAKAFHNLGNALFEQQKYEESIGAYKNALKLNPDDQETKYNLAYAQRMLKQQQQNQKQDKNQENKEENKNQDQQQNKQEQQDKKEQQEQQQNKQEQQEKEQEQQKQAEPKKDQMSKEDAERMLEALKNDELKTLEKVNKKQSKGVKIKIEKDW